jgi:hypothetical protein
MNCHPLSIKIRNVYLTQLEEEELSLSNDMESEFKDVNAYSYNIRKKPLYLIFLILSSMSFTRMLLASWR